MKVNINKSICILVGALMTWTSCKKESESIFNMFDGVNVVFHGDHPYSVTEYKEINDGDSVYIDYTITSAEEDMYQINVYQAGVETPIVREPIDDDARRRSYSGVVKLKLDVKSGETSYRVSALNENGHYIGDGYKKVTLYVRPNYTFIAHRTLYFPDDELDNGDPNCYYSISKGETYNYASGQANSGDIDFGIYREFDESTGNFRNALYSLTADPLPYTDNDISGWQKRETLFSAIRTGGSNTFNNTFRTGSRILSEAEKQTFTNRHITNLPVGSIVYFLTPEGKYGVLHVNSITLDFEDRPLMNISVKVVH